MAAVEGQQNVIYELRDGLRIEDGLAARVAIRELNPFNVE